MKVLFTGASSFTGLWFATALSTSGHDVHVTFTRESADAYGDGVRGRRVQRVAERCTPIYSCQFGDETFLNRIHSESYDLLCHHAAYAGNYKSEDFDVCGAVASNVRQVRAVLGSLLASNSSARFIFTSSYFEGGTGAGSDRLPNFSPYGLSKSLTSQVLQFYCAQLGIACGRFVIPNPFGPWEETRFTAYLMREWHAGHIATVGTPAYIRDNIHVSLLTAAYLKFIDSMPIGHGYLQRNPSGYAESQGAFAQRVAREVSKRTNWPCQIELAKQVAFDEPAVRINFEPVLPSEFDWSEPQAWDQFVDYYTAELPLIG